MAALLRTLCVVGLMAVASCVAMSQAQDQGDVAARVGDAVVTLADVEDAWNEADPRGRLERLQDLYEARRRMLDDVVGNRLIVFFERLIDRIPIVQTVYSASKKLLGLLQRPPGGGAARVVLFDFPYPGVKVIGVVMRTFTDSNTGEEIAIVYVPTTPNPTSGYLEMAPIKNLVATNMTMEDAITMIVSGGAITPKDFSLSPGPNGPTAVENPSSPDVTTPATDPAADEPREP